MTLTLAQLQSITQSAAFNALPQQAAQAALDEGKPWWQAMARSQDLAARLVVWEAAQHMAVLFDTYGELVDSVYLELTPQVDRDEVYVNTLVRINSETCREDQWDLPEEDMEAMEAADGMKAMIAAVKCLDDTPGQWVLGHLEVVQRAFADPVRSAAQARAIIEAHTGKIDALDALLRAQGLDRALEEAPQNRTVSPRM